VIVSETHSTEQKAEHRIGNPVRTPLQMAGISPAALAAADQLCAAFREPPPLTDEDRAWARDHLGLRGAYEQFVEPALLDRTSRGVRALATLIKYRSALACWERFTKPPKWRGHWPGPPVGMLTPQLLTWWHGQVVAVNSRATADSYWNHLRTIVNACKRAGVLAAAPAPERDDVDDVRVRIYEEAEIEAGYRALAVWPTLQVAWVVALNAGLRSGDLFGLRWSNVSLDGQLPAIDFVSAKTGKNQRIPLAPVTVAQLRRLGPRRPEEPVFADCQSTEAKDAERSRAARRRRDRQFVALFPIGIRDTKAMQVCRKTCNTRLNNTRDGAGEWVLGHALTLNSRHYYEPTQLIVEAVHQVPQPACFGSW
jgi:integrase